MQFGDGALCVSVEFYFSCKMLEVDVFERLVGSVAEDSALSVS